MNLNALRNHPSPDCEVSSEKDVAAAVVVVDVVLVAAGIRCGMLDIQIHLPV